MVRAHLYISGRVQGVGYRYSCHREAATRRLSGWVRNLPDGRVEAVFQGPKEDVEDMIGWCYRGPSEARVSNIDVAYEDAKDDLKGFGIR
jgi:acylphosphatase